MSGPALAAGRTLTYALAADTTRDDWGSWIYLQDLENGDVWSAADQPTGILPESQTVQFYPHMAEVRRSDHGLGLTMEITVAPEDDVEIRRISLTNHTERVRRITLTSYGEIILAPQAADARHPAFNSSFIESEYVPDANALLFGVGLFASEELIHLAHAATVSPGIRSPGRMKPIGRASWARPRCAPACIECEWRLVRHDRCHARSGYGAWPDPRTSTARLGTGEFYHVGGAVTRQGCDVGTALSRCANDRASFDQARECAPN
jgi:hypothetical protein